jgi:hypothetical protein
MPRVPQPSGRSKVGSNETIAIVDLDDAKDAVIHTIVHVILQRYILAFVPITITS